MFEEIINIIIFIFIKLTYGVIFETLKLTPKNIKIVRIKIIIHWVIFFLSIINPLIFHLIHINLYLLALLWFRQNSLQSEILLMKQQWIVLY